MPPRPKNHGCHGQTLETHGVPLASHWSDTGFVVSGVLDTSMRSTLSDRMRREATSAALIPIRKTAAWWAMTQDERRSVFEEQSHHIEIGLRYLPAVARRLHHCRDLGGDEPFDFLTWFEYAPSDEKAFDELVAELRRSPEWKFVEREVDIRLVREGK